jgi:hypothetical protein
VGDGRRTVGLVSSDFDRHGSVVPRGREYSSRPPWCILYILGERVRCGPLRAGQDVGTRAPRPGALSRSARPLTSTRRVNMLLQRVRGLVLPKLFYRHLCLLKNEDG